MDNIIGLPPRITAEKAAIILEWHRNRRTFEDWARIFDTTLTTVRNSIAAYCSPEQWVLMHERMGTGRRRLLSPEQMQTLVNWHRARRTRPQLARELGLSVWQITAVAKRGRAYVQRRRDKDTLERFAARRSRQERDRMALSSATVDPGQERLRKLRAENAKRFRAWLVVDNT